MMAFAAPDGFSHDPASGAARLAPCRVGERTCPSDFHGLETEHNRCAKALPSGSIGGRFVRFAREWPRAERVSRAVRNADPKPMADRGHSGATRGAVRVIASARAVSGRMTDIAAQQTGKCGGAALITVTIWLSHAARKAGSALELVRPSPSSFAQIPRICGM
jgi:hypothetical protein